MTNHRARSGFLAIVTLAALGVAGFAATSAAADADIRVGLYPDADAVSIGAGVLTRLGDQDRWFFNPNAEIAMGDDDLVLLNGDFHYELATDNALSFWAGGGPAVIVRDRGDNTDTNLGLNLLVGMGSSRGNARPFGQVKAIVADNAGIALTGGIRF